MDDVICEKCGKKLELGMYPFCPHEKGHNNVIGDEIDVEITNGLCNMDGTPRRWRSREEMMRQAKKQGLQPYVVHTDGDKYVKTWNVGLPPGVDARPMAMLSEEEQKKRHEEWERA